MVWTLGLTLVFGRVAAFNLGNYRPATNDEVELMSVGYTLATRGVLGSALFTGFFGADQHYFMTLPVQHVLEAATFLVFGAGVAQARWVSLVAGVAIIWIVGWLAYRWYGLATALICELLLVLWPSNLTLAADALPLLGVARVARYDVLAVAFAWLAIALLDAYLRRPRRGTGWCLGMCCGIASLTTFTGAFVVPLVTVHWLWARRHRTLTNQTLYSIAVGAAVVVLPWLVFCLHSWSDLVGQLTVYGGRWNLLQPGFLLANILHEPSRYSDLLQSSADTPRSLGSAWLLALGVWPAAGFVAWRSRASGAIGDRLVWTSLVIFGVLLVAVDQTKTPLYAVILLPSVCLAMAALLTGCLGWAWHGSPVRGRRVWRRAAASVVALGVAGIVGVEGARAYQHSLLRAAQAGQYLGVGLQIEDTLAPGTLVLGPERWWWALRAHPYLSLRGQWFQWTAAAASGGTPRFVDWVDRSQARSIVVNDNVRGDVRDFPEALQRQFWTFVDTCTTRAADLDDPTYLQIEVYTITPPAARPAACA